MHATIEQFDEPIINISEVWSAQSRWAQRSIHDRSKVLKRLRLLIAERARALAAAASTVDNRPLSEKLVSEVLPLADACKWLSRNAPRILAPRRFGRYARPFWLAGSTFEIQRAPLGVVLVIGPRNYPLFLPMVQALHALVAGNAVLIKPAPDTRFVCSAFVEIAEEAGLDRSLLVELPETEEAVDRAIRAGVDKVVFTGSSANGRAVLAKLAPGNTPAIMELSGEDAVVVLADADIGLVVRALEFGRRLNNGATCIAPRRIIVEEPVANELITRISAAGLRDIPVQKVRDINGALHAVEANEYGLGASIFSRNIQRARRLATLIKTGFVTINDVIVPTADPRVPFAGVKGSGFGVTRGEEGLLAMTFPHVVLVRRGNRRRHYDEPSERDHAIFNAAIQFAHGRPRLRA
ncbi:MAG: aldehyde dehydrogenase family protein, partial [Alphaproteobacteria bacterium]